MLTDSDVLTRVNYYKKNNSNQEYEAHSTGEISVRRVRVVLCANISFGRLLAGCASVRFSRVMNLVRDDAINSNNFGRDPIFAITAAADRTLGTLTKNFDAFAGWISGDGRAVNAAISR